MVKAGQSSGCDGIQLVIAALRSIPMNDTRFIGLVSSACLHYSWGLQCRVDMLMFNPCASNGGDAHPLHLPKAGLPWPVEITGSTVFICHNGWRLQPVGQNDVGVHGSHIQMIDERDFLPARQEHFKSC